MLLRITKRRFFWLFVVVVFLVAIFAGYKKLQAYWQKSATELFREGTVRRGDIKFEVKCTGTVEPVLKVQIGSFVSGPIQKVCVDFNDKVVKDQLLAEIDPQVFKAQCRQAQYALDNSLANLEQSKAKARQMERDYKRAQALRKEPNGTGTDNKGNCISETDFDLAEANFEMAAANVNVAKADVEQKRASLDLANTNLGYTSIRSPVDGIIIDRKVDAGQTLASSYQTPVMFIVAPDLDKKVWVLASIDEADIGLVRKAEANKQPVHFTVDAYQNEKFEGKILQVRLGPKASLTNAPTNVVTYVTVVEAPNTELKLLPGMTVNLVFRVEEHNEVLKIPNSALRFHPKPEFVQPEHLAVLEGLKPEEERDASGSSAKDKGDDEAEEKNGEAASSENKDEEKSGEKPTDEKQKSEDKDNSKGKSNAPKKKYVWVINGDKLAPVEVKVGLSDSKNAELVSGDLKEGSKVVTGMKTAAETAAKK